MDSFAHHLPSGKTLSLALLILSFSLHEGTDHFPSVNAEEAHSLKLAGVKHLAISQKCAERCVISGHPFTGL